MPPLWANAELPTNGWPRRKFMFAVSYTNRLSSVSRSSPPGPRTSIPSFSDRFAQAAIRSALPHRSPTPLIVPCTCTAPARTAARVFAVARSESLWQWMPTGQRTASFAAATASATKSGRLPPLVSHSTPISAPASAAARSVSRAKSGSER